MPFLVRRVELVDSTNDEVARLAAVGAPEWTVVVAERQSAGRGRRGRRWESEAGAGLYLSVLLRPDLPFGKLWQLGFVASLAVADAVRRVTRLEARTKWPNDVLVGGRKVCGVLVEARPGAGDRHAVVIGIGVNVNTRAFPDELAAKATSLSIEASASFSLADVESALLDALRTGYGRLQSEGFDPLLRRWMEWDCTVGRSVHVDLGETQIDGTAVAVDAGGSLVVELADGTRAFVAAGDVMLR